MSTEGLTLEERRARFSRLCEEALLSAHQSGEDGIGTLGEKRLHALVKRYLCEDTDCHEVGVKNTRFVSDVRMGNDVLEVQTGAFYPMHKKILYYLENTDCTVTVVHPVTVKKWTCRIDAETGRASERKRSPRPDRPIELLAEMYSLLPATICSRLRFRLLSIEAQDFRLESAKKGRRAPKRFERVPLALIDDVTYTSPQDLIPLLPQELPHHFAVKDFSRLSHLRGRDAYSAVRTLVALDLIAPAEPIGRAMAFERRF